MSETTAEKRGYTLDPVTFEVLKNAFVTTVGTLEPDALGRDEQLAFYINAYNALVIKAVLAKLPIDSVMSAPGFFDREKHVVAGQEMTLNHLENEIIRSARFAEPRIHFLVNCASVGCPRRDVALLVGDGGLALALAELITAAEHAARVRAIVFNDGGYGILRRVQDQRFDGRRVGVDLQTPDYVQLAGSMGIWAAQVRSPAEMAPQLDEALQQEGPALIEIDMQALG